MKYWTWLLVNDIGRMSGWLIISQCKEKQREERQILIYAVTLREYALFTGLVANRIQLGWWTVPIKFLPSLFALLGTWWMTNQGGSWMSIMSKCDWVSRIVLTIQWSLQTFCKRMLRFFKIIFAACHSPRSESIWSCFHRSWRISFSATPCWIDISRMGTGWSQLGDHPCN